jgi:hypothetical protein
MASRNGMKAIVLKEVASFTGRPEVYQIRMTTGGQTYCTCPAWRFSREHQPCKHMKSFGFGTAYEPLMA